ncbi:MAG: GGDEF domain-containing protein [Prochlorotrichaceae cyanobacterium]
MTSVSPLRQSLLKFFEKQPKRVVAGLVFLMIPLISLIDYFLLPQLTFSLFYLGPISLATWFVSKRMGTIAAVFSALAWLKVDLDTITFLYPAIPYCNMGLRLGVFLTVVWLMDVQKLAYERERKWARMDGLTGIYNCRAFLDLAGVEIHRAHRYQYPLTIAYLDVDDFKQVNDQWGHSMGDRLLQKIATTLQRSIRQGDIVARLGGDEFALLLPHTNDESAQKLLPRLQQYLLDINDTEPWSVGFSIGAVTFLESPESVEHLIAQADRLMYTVKQTSKNRLEHQVIPKKSEIGHFD